jgi:single-strand DNA-binding protein
MNNNAGDNQGYNPQGSYNQPAQNQYNNTSNTQGSQQNNYGGKTQATPMPEQKIPEIDIDEDEIPF